MPLIVPDDGELYLLDLLLDNSITTTFPPVLRLYRNDYTPGPSTQLADFAEANFSGYVGVALPGGSWNPAETIGGKAVATWGSDAIVWTCGASGGTVYGYYITDGESLGLVLWAQRFDAPVILTSGQALGIVPTFSGFSEF